MRLRGVPVRRWNGAKTEGRRLDGIGALACAASLLGLVFGVININHLGLLRPRVLQSLAVGIGVLLAFVWWERRARDPLLDVTLFRNRIVSVKENKSTIASLPTFLKMTIVRVGGLKAKS